MLQAHSNFVQDGIATVPIPRFSDEVAMDGMTGDTQLAGLGALLSLSARVPEVAASPVAGCLTEPIPVVEPVAWKLRQPRVIALIPAHNEFPELGDTIEAILGQTRVPDEVYVLTDNVENERLWDLALSYPVSVTCTVGNHYRKAGNLNSALALLLPWLDEGDIIMGFDADSIPDRHFVANALRWLRKGYGAVGATFHGREGGGMLGLLQRSEFARFARHQHRKVRCDVLSGTGWAIPVRLMRRIAASRPDGGVYDVKHITEDFELTLAIRLAGVAAVAPSDCSVTTDVMTTVKDWVSQRLRWQYGTLITLRHYGWSAETREMIVRQAMIYLVMLATPLTAVYLIWSFLIFGWRGINPLNAPIYAIGIGIVVLEQAWQARKAGVRAVLSTLVIWPDLLYSAARQVIYIRALWRLVRNKATSWGAGTSQ